VLWGIGGLTFGLSMRYLGIALGYAIALGLCAAFGTLVPPLFRGDLSSVIQTTSGQVTLLGVLVCLIGITLSGKAGMNKEKELSDEQKKEKIKEFNFLKGLCVALFAGAMSASMSYGLAAGKPIATLAIEKGAPTLWQTLPVLAVVLLGGFTTNFIWCIYLILKKGTLTEYWRSTYGGERVSLTRNYLFCIFGGVLWYLQFFFYGMGTTKMGRYDFSSWSLHMASIIIFSTLWGVALKEWKGTSRHTHLWIALGLATLILSTIIIGFGNKLALPG
jgi:L-rhamnose-H+ transport protein